MEDYCLGKIPWGPWDARSVHRWAAEGQKERETLKKIVRAGIIPLQMYGGGAQTYQTRDLKFEDGWKPILPEWAQSKGRAYFDFVVLFPGGAREGNWLYREQNQGRADFMNRLFSHRQHSVSFWVHEHRSAGQMRRRAPQITEWWHDIARAKKARHASPAPRRGWLEAGARKAWKYLLPFKENEVLVAGKTMEAWKEDLVLEEYIDKPWIDVPLLVHVEALDSKPVAPDQVVLGLLEQARVGDVWPEWRMEESLGELYTQLRVDWKS